MNTTPTTPDSAPDQFDSEHEQRWPNATTPAPVAGELPPLPPYIYGRECYADERVYPADEIHAWQARAALSQPASAPPSPEVKGLTETHAELWRHAVRKGLITVHSELIHERNPGTRCSWIEGHAHAADISNEAAAWGVKLEGGE